MNCRVGIYVRFTNDASERIVLDEVLHSNATDHSDGMSHGQR